MHPEQLSTTDQREICADHLSNLQALQRRAARTPIKPYLEDIPQCLVRASDPRCGDPRLTKSTALTVAEAATRAAGRMDSLHHVDMALELAKAAMRAHETACAFLSARRDAAPSA